MARFAVVCKETWVVLDYVNAENPTCALDLAKDLYPGKVVSVSYAEDCIASE